MLGFFLFLFLKGGRGTRLYSDKQEPILQVLGFSLYLKAFESQSSGNVFSCKCPHSGLRLTAERTNEGQRLQRHVSLSLSLSPSFFLSYPPLLFFLSSCIFPSLNLSLYSSLAPLPGKSKSCVTIATAAVCENYLNPSLFFFFLLCVPSDIQWILF